MSEGQIHRLKRQFIAEKTKQLNKDKKYGFKLSEIPQKIKRNDLADKVQMLKQRLEQAKKKEQATPNEDQVVE